MLSLGLVLVAAVAPAQERGVGGVARAADDGDLADLGSLWRPEHQVPGAAGIVAGLGPRLGDLERPVGGGLSATVGLHKRLGVSAVVPFPGTMRFGIPIGLVVPSQHVGGFGVSFIPEVALTDAGLGGEGTLALGYGGASWQVAANLGGGIGLIDGVSASETLGARFAGGLGGSVELARTLAVRAGVDVESDLGGNLDLEGGLSVRGRYRSGLSWTVGAAAAPLRESNRLLPYAQVGFVLGRSMDRDADLDGVVDAYDACRFEPEVVNDYDDEDGCPDELSTLSLKLMDLAGTPVVGASLQVGSVSAVSDETGGAAFAGLMPDSEPRVLIDARGFTTKYTEGEAVYPGDNVRVVILDWVPTVLRVSARDAATGAPIDAHLRIEGPGNVDTQDLGDDGVESVDLRPGTWRVVVYADFFEGNEQDIVVEPGQALIDHAVLLGRAKLERSKEETLNLVTLRFQPGTEVLDPQWVGYLDDVAHAMLVHSYAQLSVFARSEAQAEVVVAALTALGVPAQRLTIVASPDSAPDAVTFQVQPPVEVLVPELVRFAPGASALTADTAAGLDGLAALMDKHSLRRFHLLAGAHRSDLAPVEDADPEAPEAALTGAELATLQALAIQRAAAVRTALIERGVGAERLSVRTLDPAATAVVPAYARSVALRPVPVDDLGWRVAVEPAAEQLGDEVAATLGPVVSRLKAMPQARVRVESGRGSGTAAAATARAEALVAALTEAGVAPERLSVAVEAGAAELRLTFLEPRALHDGFLFGDKGALDPSAVLAAERLSREVLRHPARQIDLIGERVEGERDEAVQARLDGAKAALLAAGVEEAQIRSVSSSAPAPVPEGGEVDPMMKRVDVQWSSADAPAN